MCSQIEMLPKLIYRLRVCVCVKRLIKGVSAVCSFIKDRDPLKLLSLAMNVFGKNVKKVYIGHASLYKYVVYMLYMCVYIIELYIVLLLLSIKRAQQLKILKRNEPSVGF